MVNWFKKLKPGMQIFIVILLIVVLWQAWKFAKGFIKTSQDLSNEAGEEAAYIVSGMEKTFKDSQYNSFAEQLHYAMDGLGTDEEIIFAVFNQMQNDLDIIALNKAFGIREGLGLQAWLREDLSSSDMSEINQLLANKGITKTY